MLLVRNQFKYTNRWKGEVWKELKLIAGVTLLILHKVDFREKSITRDKEGNFIMTKRAIHQNDKQP